jgi:pyruvate kinase
LQRPDIEYKRLWPIVKLPAEKVESFFVAFRIYFAILRSSSRQLPDYARRGEDTSYKMARTKIVCTIGPACDSDDQLRAMVSAGMNVARLNFSHGTRDYHRSLAGRIRRVAEQASAPLAILQDLCGPKLRIGSFQKGPVFLRPGDTFVLTSKEVPGDEKQVHLDFPELEAAARTAGRALLSDGLIELSVTDVAPGRVTTEVKLGGWLSDHKGICFPGRASTVAALTDKDMEDLRVGVEMGVDYVALSFVRNHEDVLQLKELIAGEGSRAGVIAKLERVEALDDLVPILDASDAVMVARGDLGVELSPEKVPMVQKEIIREAQRHDVYVITATQMLESMTHNPMPTRAEASDVANAVLDGTDAVMLSGETATGKYPVRAVEVMERIALEAESAKWEQEARRRCESLNRNSIPGAISWAAAHIAGLTGAKAICAFTHSGGTAKLLCKSRPDVPIIGLTPFEEICNQLSLAWGVDPVLCRPLQGHSEMVQEAERVAVEKGLARHGDAIVIVAGYPPGRREGTNVLKVHRVGQPGPFDWASLDGGLP